MAILGIDLGNCNIKTSENIIFPSKITTEESLFESELQIEIDNKKYIIGEGEYQTELDKTKKDNILPMLYTAIAKSTMDKVNQIVIGLPAQYYKNNSSRITELIMNNRMMKFKINGENREIIISEVMVFPEGVGAYYSLPGNIKSLIRDQHMIILDIGGRTTEIILFEFNGKKRVIKNAKTLEVGTINIYSDFIKEVNSKYTLGLKIEEAEAIMKRGLWVDGEKQDLSFAKEVMKRHFDSIMKELNINYPIRTSPLLTCGGGGELLYSPIKKRIPGALLIENSIFANSLGFKEVGIRTWLKRD